MSTVPRLRREDDPRAAPVLTSMPVSPERRLWIAVLENALQDINTTARYGYRYQERQVAIDWIGSRRFREVCMLAGLDPEWIEGGIRARLASGEHFDLSTRRAAPEIAA